VTGSSAHHRRGIAFCAASACGFGAMAVFAKEAYATGATAVTLLAVRFVLAALVLFGGSAGAGAGSGALHLGSRRSTARRSAPRGWPAACSSSARS
jgi:hypothetical protein